MINCPHFFQNLQFSNLAGLGQQQQVAAASGPTILGDKVHLFQAFLQVRRDGILFEVEVVEPKHQQVKWLKIVQ